VTQLRRLGAIHACSVSGSALTDLKTEGQMGTWLLLLSCLGDAAACNAALPWKEIRFGSQARCMVEGDSIVKRIGRTNLDDNIVITYSCRPYTEKDAENDAAKARHDGDGDDK
jgi:hypothetical protein